MYSRLFTSEFAGDKGDATHNPADVTGKATPTATGGVGVRSVVGVDDDDDEDGVNGSDEYLNGFESGDDATSGSDNDDFEDSESSESESEDESNDMTGIIGGGSGSATGGGGGGGEEDVSQLGNSSLFSPVSTFGTVGHTPPRSLSQYSPSCPSSTPTPRFPASMADTTRSLRFSTSMADISSGHIIGNTNTPIAAKCHVNGIRRSPTGAMEQRPFNLGETMDGVAIDWGLSVRTSPTGLLTGGSDASGNGCAPGQLSGQGQQAGDGFASMHTTTQGSGGADGWTQSGASMFSSPTRCSPSGLSSIGATHTPTTRLLQRDLDNTPNW
jgi:hypothetical protein